MYNYTGKVLRVVDGDTLDIEIDLGFGIKFTNRFRLYGINTPEIYGVKKDSEEYKAGIASLNYLTTLLPVGTMIQVETFKDAKEKYGRYLARVRVIGAPLTINDVMVATGNAQTYVP